MDYSRSRVHVPANENSPHARLRTFLNVIYQPNRLGLLDRRLGLFFLLLLFSISLRGSRASASVRFLRRRSGGNTFRCRRKARFGKSFVKIKRQYIVPVRRHPEIRIRLSRSRAYNGAKLILLKSMNPLDQQRRNARLLPFLDLEADKHVALFAFVIVFDLRLDLRVEKPVRLIKVAHRLRVGINQPPAKPSRRSEGAPEDLQSASQQFLIEIPVPRDFDPDQFVANAPFHLVTNNLFRARRRSAIGLHLMRLGRVIYFRVEIALAFQSLANIAFSLLQKVGVN